MKAIKRKEKFIKSLIVIAVFFAKSIAFFYRQYLRIKILFNKEWQINRRLRNKHKPLDEITDEEILSLIKSYSA